MCLAIPGRVLEFHEEGGLRMSRVDFGGVTRQACLEYLPEAQVGDYVLVHAGFAITRVDAEEAARTLEAIAELGQADEAP
jgi:hydrogenase expression/formation protein HypC